MVINADSQVGWDLVTNGVTEARLEVQRIQHLMHRILQLSRNPETSEIIHKLLGDFINDAPGRVDRLEGVLDRTLFVLAKKGVESLKSRLGLGDLTLVEDSLENSKQSYLDTNLLARHYMRRVTVQQEARRNES